MEHALHRLWVDGLLQVGAGAQPQAFLDVALRAQRTEDHHAALRVEFEEGPVVVLNADALMQTVTLRKPVVARILGLEPGYRYRLVVVGAQGGERVHDGLAGVGHLQVALPQG